MFDVEKEKLAIIEEILHTNDEEKLLAIKHLLNDSLDDIKMKPMSVDDFYSSIRKSEKSLAEGRKKSHSEVKELIESWKRK